MKNWKIVGRSDKTAGNALFDNGIGAAKDRLDWRKYLTTKDAATYIGSTPAGIRNRVYRRQLFPKKFFGRLMFRRADLDRLIETSK